MPTVEVVVNEVLDEEQAKAVRARMREQMPRRCPVNDAHADAFGELNSDASGGVTTFFADVCCDAMAERTRAAMEKVRDRLDPAGMQALADAIKHAHQCEAADWIESVPVRETHEGRVVWDGDVQVFRVKHPKAPRVYAWSHETSAGKRRFFAVLHVPPVVSAVDAVRAAIVSETRHSN